MSLFAQGRALLRSVAASNYEADITPYVTTTVADPRFPNQTKTVHTPGVSSFSGNLYPAGQEAIERGGLNSLVGIYRLICESVDLKPERQVRISAKEGHYLIVPDDTDFVVKRSLPYMSLSEVFLERIS